jgi:hypothetical protein
VTKTSGSDALGEFKFPPELQALYQRIVKEGQGAFDRPQGYTDEAISAMFGQGFEGVRDQQTAAQQQLQQLLASSGQLGTGSEISKQGDLGWQAENAISNLKRDIFLKNEDQKRQDWINNVTQGQGLFNTGEKFISDQEALNSVRRNESLANWKMLMELLGLGV